MPDIENLHSFREISPVERGRKSLARVEAGDKRVPSFSETLKKFIGDVNQMQNHADRSIEKMVAGEITDVHQVMVAVEEANTAFNLMMEIRNKMMEAYQDILRMQI